MSEQRKPGRPALPPEQRRGATIPPVRCSLAQREKFDRLGGAEWLRKAIDRARG